MAKTAYIRARVEPELKQEVEEILSQIGLNSSDAISLFYNKIKIENGIPFDLKAPQKIPNQETIEAMQEVLDPEKRKKLKLYDNVEEMFAEILAEEDDEE